MTRSPGSADSALEQARAIAAAAARRGGRALVVGGWVRDRLLGIASKDLDLEIYGISEPELAALLAPFGRVDPIGQQFPVYKIGAIDVALPRRESKSGRGHRGFAVQGDPSMTVREAARRRDFTINAIAWDPLTETYEDPYDGRSDLAARILRVVDAETFADDSLRVLRALQFAARFDLRVTEETRAICAGIPLDDLPAERIWGELEKLLLRARRPSLGFELGRELGVIARIAPEMDALVGCEQEPEWHPEGDVWTHTLLVVDGAAARLDDLEHARQVIVMLGAVCHDFGKPATTAFLEGRIRSIGHEEAGVPPATAFLDRLNVHALDGVDVRRHVLGIVAHHLKPGMWHRVREEVGDGAFRRLAQKVDLELLARVASADCHGRTGAFDCSAMEWFLDRARALGVEHQPPPRLVLGRHLLPLGVPPGPAMGRLLAALYERQLDGEITTTDEGIAVARRLIASGEPW